MELGVQDGFVKSAGAAEIGDEDFEPVDGVVFHGVWDWSSGLLFLQDTHMKAGATDNPMSGVILND
ncbi:hypothetical protein GCM10023213_02010 [Prosthecobacter algae]|uniref:Uncharacterized protein n=1 Tax=Prosthecobacter algae TaxID=1144682 RepID=A0ABP9NX93_9BACT